MKLYVRLLNLGFRKEKDKYICEDIVVEIRDDKLFVPHLQMEITIDELESTMLAD